MTMHNTGLERITRDLDRILKTFPQRVMIHSAGLPPVISASPEFETQNAEIME